MEECTGFEPVNRITTINVLAGHRNRPTLPTFHMEEAIRIKLTINLHHCVTYYATPYIILIITLNYKIVKDYFQ